MSFITFYITFLQNNRLLPLSSHRQPYEAIPSGDSSRNQDSPIDDRFGLLWIFLYLYAGNNTLFLYLLAIMVPRICQLSTMSIRCCCIFRAWVTVLRALLTLWGLFCYRFFSEDFIYIVHQFS